MSLEPALAEPTRPLCAVHPELPSAGTCARCGRFACEQCFRPSDGLCAECAQRTADPLGTRGPFTLEGTLASGWRLFVATRWTVLGVAVAMALVGGAMTLAAAPLMSTGAGSVGWNRSAASLAGVVKVLLVNTWLYGALLAQMAAAARGESISPLQALGRSTKAWPRMFVAQLVATVLSVLGFALCLIPGFYASAALWVVLPAAYLEPGRPAAERSGELTRGRRWLVLGTSMLAHSPTIAIYGARILAAWWVMRVDWPLSERTLVLSAVSIGLDLVRGATESFEHALATAGYLRLRDSPPLTE